MSTSPAAIPAPYRKATAWMVFRATVVKDLRISRRYVPDLAGRLIEIGVRVGFFMLLSNVVSVSAEKSPLGMVMGGHDLMVFFLGALLLFVFNATALSSPAESVGRDLYNGTLEYLYSNPASRYAYFAGTVAASAILNSVVFAPVFVVLIVIARPEPGAMALILAACVAVVGTVVAFGILIGLLAILWRQIGSIVHVLNIAFELLAGAYFPVSAFPQPLRSLAYALPYTWGYDLIRYYSFAGRWKTILPVWAEWLLLACSAAVFLALSRFLLQRVERRAKRAGLHLL